MNERKDEQWLDRELQRAVDDNPENVLAWQGLAQEYGAAGPAAAPGRPARRPHPTPAGPARGGLTGGPPGSPRSPATGPGAAGTIAELSEIEAELYQVKNRSPKDKIAFPIRLNDRLAGLLAIVDTGDGAPTAAARTVADQLIAELEAHLARLERVLRKF